VNLAKQEKLESSVSSSKNNKASEAAKAAAAKLEANKQEKKKNPVGRPPGTKKEQVAEAAPKAAGNESVEFLVKVFPRILSIVYEQLGNRYCEAVKATPLTKGEISEFENQVDVWLKLENIAIDPLWGARIGVGVAFTMPLVVRHPKFTELLMNLSGNAKQNNISVRKEGERQDNARATGPSQEQKPGDSAGSSSGVSGGDNIHKLQSVI
jgi:hypothetical protein